MVTLDTEQKPERHCSRRVCIICKRVKRVNDNKALKVKLQLRRSYHQLVDQGIMPPKKTPPAYHEQAKQLERRKTGDLLKAKIQQRPGREELVRQHILEDVGYVDPSLAERQRMLKKARLADQLNDQLSHRPGPLELIQKNILHTEEPIERAVKEGQIPFKATCEGQLTKPQHPDHYITFEDDSQSSEGGAPSPPQEGSTATASVAATSTTASSSTTTTTATSTSTSTTAATTEPPKTPAGPDVLEAAAASAGIVVSLSIPTSEGAVVVTSAAPGFESVGAAPEKDAAQTTATAASPSKSFVVTSSQELSQQAQQHVAAQVAEASPLLISIASPGSSMSPLTSTATTTTTTTTLIPLAPAPSPMSLGSTTSSLSPLSNISIASPPAAITPRPQPSPIAVVVTSAQPQPQQQQQKSDAPGKDKNRKKSKNKSQPKTRTIKFHEYKGPPNAQKSGASSSAASAAQQGETHYELLLQQQQLFLQWQVEFNNKGSGQIHQPRMFPQLILPAQNKIPLPANSAASDSMSMSVPSPASSNASSNPSEQPPLRPLGKLEDMKVSDLKVELKRRNLPVSGSKPQLIERLKPFTESSSGNATSGSNVTQMGHILMDAPAPMATDESNSQKGPNSPKDESMASPRIGSPHGSEKDESSSPPGDNILKEHYRKKIEELQREIFKMRSQQQFQQFQQNQPVRAENKLVLQQHLQNKMQQQNLTRQLQRYQHLQQQYQVQQQQQQQQQLTFQQLNAKANLAAFLQAQPNNATATAILDSATLTAINNKKNQTKCNGTTTVQVPTAIVLNLAKPTKINGSILGALVAQAQSQQQQQQQQQQIAASAKDGKPPPPQYDEAAKLLKVKIEPLQKNPVVKSQMVDDVLEILINSGELPPSAAQEPVTPTTPGRQIAQGLVLSAPADSQTQSLVFAAAPSPMEITQSECGSPAPPPPPPPLPLASFSIQLPSELQQQQQQQRSRRSQQQQDTSFSTDMLSSDSELDAAMLMSPQSVQHGSPDPQPPQEVTSSDNANLDLKELGLDLDTMDFGQLDCDFGVKMETPQEFMDIGDMPMDMDEPDWLDSLMPPQSPAHSASATSTSSAVGATTSGTTSAGGAEANSEQHHDQQQHGTSCSTGHSSDLYDPLLGNSQDPFDLFSIGDPDDFKMSSDLPLSWDNGQVDFAT